MLGTILTGFGIFQASELSDKTMEEKFIIPSQVLNGLTVMFLLYLTATSSFSNSYKLFIIVVLVGGMILEIYLTSYADRKPESIAAYVFVTLNFLIRSFFLIDLIQGEWVSPIVKSVKPVQAVVKDTIVAPLQEAVKEATMPAPESVAKPEVSEDIGRELVSKWDKLKNSIRTRPEGLNEESTKEAWKSVIRPAKDEGRKDIKEVLREAVGKLTDKDGNPVPLNSVDAVGGRKRRS